MKSLVNLFAIASVISFSSCGQGSKNLPENVKTAFSAMFPDASNVKWDKENETEWEAEFKMSGKEYSANFDSAGKWMETEFEIAVSDIPAEVKASLDKEFPEGKIEESEISETADGKAYEFSIKQGKELVEVSMDSGGNIITKKEVNEDEEDQD